MSVKGLSRHRQGLTDGLHPGDINIPEKQRKNLRSNEQNCMKISARFTLNAMSTVVFIAHLLLLIIDTLRHNIFNLLHE